MNLYDFDETIYKKDSPTQFYLYCVKHHPRIWWHLFRTGFWGFLKILKIIPLKKFKERFFTFVKYLPDYKQDLKNFWNQEIININSWYYDQRKDDDVICSATPRFMMEEIVPRINKNATLICSELDPKTGKFIDNQENCKGEEKVNRLKLLNFTHFEKGYSDSKSDIPMLKMCDKKFLVNEGKITDLNDKYFN